ncbi:hypothetical protein G6F55_014399 [Rhizopus delemar]|nr:hypothetical protein G6F55_014399 [Rhizopus delemar]
MRAGKLAQVDGLGGGVEDVAHDLAGQQAVAVGEEGEAAGDQQALDACGLGGTDQAFRARVQSQLFHVDLF